MQREEEAVYIGIGAIVLIVIVVLLVRVVLMA
jgi:hypothetical protein